MHYHQHMLLHTLRERYGAASPTAQATVRMVAFLAIGLVIMPALIFLAGILLLGRYEGASVAHMYGSIYAGLGSLNVADWVVVLGPALLYGLWRLLTTWWHWSRN